MPFHILIVRFLLFILIFMAPIKGYTEEIDKNFDIILNVIITSLKNVAIHKVTKNEYIGLINIKGCSPNCKLEPERQYSGDFTFVGLSMFDNSDRQVFTTGVIIKNGIVYSGSYNTTFITPLSTAKYVHDVHKNYLNNNYNIIGENSYDIKDGCTASLLFTQGYKKFSNSGSTSINIKCN